MDQAETAKTLRKKLKSKRQELKRVRTEAKDKESNRERSEHKKRKKTILQEILQLEQDIRAAREGQVEGRPVVATGALPNFIVIGGKKCGTTFFYHLLTQHPCIEPAASKELHFFDAHFEMGVEWYRQCFPAPRWEDGRRTITGEATPYMSYRHAPERTAEVVPEARLIALLRNPIDRAYSDYQMGLRKEREPRTFEEAIGVAQKARSPARGGGEPLQREDRLGRPGYLSRSIYVDQLMRWTEFFDREQLLVLKSEDFFEHPQETLNTTFEFLGLPEWEPQASQIKPKKRNEGGYEGGMSEAARARLEGYFEPHNRQLYEFLGRDFGW